MIGYYVHHHGNGHRTRAEQIALRLQSEVIGFSSLPAPAHWPGEWCRLPGDTTDDPVGPTAHGTLHWAPLDHPGHRERLGVIARWLTRDLRLLVVDTSAEVAMLGRLFGVRTVVVAMRGDRFDRPHRMAYDAADLLLAPWRAETADEWPEHWRRKTIHTGAISRFDGRPAVPVADGANPRVLLIWGAGGTAVTDRQFAAARSATPEWQWTIRSAQHPSSDLWQDLMEVDVVVSHAGQNAVAEVAVARRPAVVVAQPRPHDEQLATVQALRRFDICIGLDAWPEAEEWPVILSRAAAMGGRTWSRWTHGDGAHRAAAVLERLHARAR